MNKKITWDYLSVEITRRCNLKCAHCLRGDAQEIDMKFETIDALLDKTDAIHKLLITGGEPTLNIEGIRYFLESAKKRNVMIPILNIVTNGIVRNETVVQLIKDFSAYCQSFPVIDGAEKVQAKKRVIIGISTDDFHETDSETAYKWYCDNLSDVAVILRARQGDIAYNVGRGKNLPYAFVQPQGNKIRIEYLSSEHTPICQDCKIQKPFCADQIIILCGINITVHGAMIRSDIKLDISDEDSGEYTIGDVFVDSAKEIIENIERYNADKKYCIESNFESKNKHLGVLEQYKRYHELKRIVQSHPNPTKLLSAFAIKNIDKASIIMPTLLELNGNKPLDYTTVGIDTSDLSHIWESISNAYYEFNNTSPQVEEFSKSELTEITDEEMERLYHKAIVTRLTEYFPVYNNLALKRLQEPDQTTWKLLYASFASSNRLYYNTLELLKIKPDSSDYAQRSRDYQAYVTRDFNKLVSFIKDHPLKEDK